MSEKLKELEMELNKKVNKIRGVILPFVNLFFIPLSFLSLYYLDSLKVVESIILIFVILAINLIIINKITIKKERKISEVVYSDILPDIFSKYFKTFKVKQNEGLSIAKIKKSDLLSVSNSSIFDSEDYIKFNLNSLECEMSDVRNSVNSSEYGGNTVDCGVLVKIKTTKNKFKFVIRDVGKFDYEKEMFMKEKIDLYVTDNEEFDKKYSCYTNNPKLMKGFLNKERVSYLMNMYKKNRIEISNNEEELFVFINNLTLDFDNKYDENYNLDVEKIKESSNTSLTTLIDVINDLNM